MLLLLLFTVWTFHIPILHTPLATPRLFVYCYNQRQLMQRLYPKYSFHLIDFVALPV